MQNKTTVSVLFVLANGALRTQGKEATSGKAQMALAFIQRLYADTPSDAQASASLYRIIATAKANAHEPYRYPRYLFTEPPKESPPK